MEKSNLIKTIYVYVLLITSIIILMVNSVSALNSVVDLTYPTPYLQTFDEFAMSKQNFIPNPAPITTTPTVIAPETPTKPISASREDYEVYRTETTLREKRETSKRLIKDIVWVAASGVLLWFSLREKKSLSK